MDSVVVLDAGTLIALHSASDIHHSWALETFRVTVSAEYEMTALTLAEALVHPVRTGTQDRFLANVRGLRIKITDIPESAALSLAKLSAEANLKMPAALVLH